MNDKFFIFFIFQAMTQIKVGKKQPAITYILHICELNEYTLVVRTKEG
jgi:hypothetical protein